MTETVRSYKELKIWQKGIEVVKLVYSITKKFPKLEDALCTYQQTSIVVSMSTFH
jgi:23S rRNA-intervening sequence protein